MTKLSHITMELAREPGHPQGDRDIGYQLNIPLTEDGHIDAAAWKRHRSGCTVRRMRPGEVIRQGRIVHGSGGRWLFDYDDRQDFDDEVGIKLGSERFVPGEYVSIREADGEVHTFQIVSVRPQE